MKKLLQINSVCYGSTGKIMYNIQKEAMKNGYETLSLYGRGKGFNLPCKKISNKLSFFIHASLSTIFGLHGHFSNHSTKLLIKEIEKFNPDIIHMHNIHGFYLNYKFLFNYLKKNFKGKIIWHLHDCWSFTGHCASFAAIKCNKWENGCYKCEQKNTYPPSIFFDNCKKEYNRKKEIFSNVNNLEIIVPSKYMYDNLKISFLKNYEINLIHNSIDNKKFKPYINNEIIKKKYNIPEDKKIYLGVSNIWSKNKGLNIFLEMNKYLNEDEILVIVGLNKKQLKLLDKNIIGIERTQSQEELAQIYSLANVFINPSLEESFSLTTLESIFCGTPVVVAGNSAMKELVINEKIGKVINLKDYNEKKFLSEARKLKTKIEKKDIKFYNEKYNNKTICSKIINLYEKEK